VGLVAAIHDDPAHAGRAHLAEAIFCCAAVRISTGHPVEIGNGQIIILRRLPDSPRKPRKDFDI
jgi:hypothetical protein